ncbi:hypothetical protein BGZ65_008105 [Modicella reniformis]|uniref:Uncharacterized protein n=1 Tax=Modicella reniformis TaxID=1440133 RepID=A0A9P6JGT6_9FUNG|nr:hypothetical protein BGZ65_008105 [Modicella reniformis]
MSACHDSSKIFSELTAIWEEFTKDLIKAIRYGPNNVSWKKASLKEMDEVDENEEDPNDNDGVKQELEFVEVSMEEDANRHTTKSIIIQVKEAKVVVQKDGDTARRGTSSFYLTDTFRMHHHTAITTYSSGWYPGR